MDLEFYVWVKIDGWGSVAYAGDNLKLLSMYVAAGHLDWHRLKE